jgi:hypothetical protein
LTPNELQVDSLVTHVRVRSPQYLLPPDQVLSTFPPAGSEGSYGSRLPQVVIRRRTLPWERSVGAGHDDQPWLALVLIAEGEAELRLNQPIRECVTEGVRLDEPADAELGNCLAIRQSVVDRIFPTQEEVHLLAHAREVDIHDTELMMGDDDGFLAVVISNRLPLPGRDPSGSEAPVKYLACLVNLCGQFESLLERAPEPKITTKFPLAEHTVFDLASLDHAMMSTSPYAQPRAPGTSPSRAPTTITQSIAGSASIDARTAAPYERATGWEPAGPSRGLSDVYADMAREFATAHVHGFVGDRVISLDPELRFPVLLHWSFTSVGNTTFRKLMEDLDSGLLGTLPLNAEAAGRPPFEVVETGHVGLGHRTRRGDPVRSWYRGPFVPHPTSDPADERLPLAHAADQVRVVVPDGREDISLAAAFEIGRLLALSRPSMIAALMRWRQLAYQTANLRGSFDGLPEFESVLEGLDLGRDIGGLLALNVVEAVVRRPEQVLGQPRPLVDPGRTVLADVPAGDVLARGFGLEPEVLRGGLDVVVNTLRETEVRVPEGGPDGGVRGVAEVLGPRLDQQFTRFAVQSLAPLIRTGEIRLDRLDQLPVDLHGRLGQLPGVLNPFDVARDLDPLERLLTAQRSAPDEAEEFASDLADGDDNSDSEGLDR